MVDQRGAEGRVRGTVLMFLERPDRVRFDAMTQLGPAAVLTSDGARFALTDLRDERYLEGEACPANIERLLGIRMSGAEVARLLMGDTPRLHAVGAPTMACKRGRYRVTLRDAAGFRQVIELTAAPTDAGSAGSAGGEGGEGGVGSMGSMGSDGRLARSTLYGPDGSRLWTVEFRDYRAVPLGEGAAAATVQMPFVVHFVDEAHDVDTLVRFRKITLGVVVPEGAFEQSPRPGLVPEHVACEPSPGR